MLCFRLLLAVASALMFAGCHSNCAAEEGSSTNVDNFGLTWVRIPGGTFQMGSNHGADDEKPVHSVTLSTFEMTATEVTVAQYRKCVDAGVCNVPYADGSYCNWGISDRNNYPVNCVDWNHATTYAKWVGGRLPTEAEWEYAARSGGRNHKYPWGNQTATCSYAVMEENGGRGCGRESTWPVCSKPAGNTSQGLCDMSGNVWEWVEDWYDSGYYKNSPSSNPIGPVSGSYRIARGGAFGMFMAVSREYYYDTLRTSNRASIIPSCGPNIYIFSLGFRCARDVR